MAEQITKAQSQLQDGTYNFRQRSTNETPQERKVRAFACRCVLLVKMNDLNPKITSLQNKWRTIVARSVLSDKQDELQEKKAARKAAKKIRHATLKIRKRIASRTLQVFTNTIRPDLQKAIEKRQSEARATGAEIASKGHEEKTTEERQMVKAVVVRVPSKHHTPEEIIAQKKAKKERRKKRERKQKAEKKRLQQEALAQAERLKKEAALALRFSRITRTSASGIFRKNVYDQAVSSGKFSDPQIAFLELLLASGFPMLPNFISQHTSHFYNIILLIETGSFSQKKLISAFDTDDYISQDEYEDMFQFITMQLSASPYHDPNKDSEDQMVIICKSSKHILHLSRELLLKVRFCRSLSTNQSFKVILPQKNAANFRTLHSWAYALVRGLETYKKTLARSAGSIPPKEELTTAVFTQLKKIIRVPVVAAFKKIRVIVSPLINTDPQIWAIELSIFLKDIQGEGAFSWLLPTLAEAIATNGLKDTMVSWDRMYDGEASDELGRKLLDTLKAEEPFHQVLVTNVASEIDDEILVAKMRGTIKEAYASDCISLLDRLSLMHHILQNMEEDNFLKKDLEAMGKKTIEEFLFKYFEAKIAVLHKEDLQVIRSKEWNRRAKSNQLASAYTDNLDTLLGIYTHIYQETASAMDKSVTYLTTAAEVVYEFAQELRLSGL